MFLFMDDDEDIVKIPGSMLEFLGYTFDSVADGNKAYNLYKKKSESADPYAFIILDLTIAGGMGGIECAERIHEFDSNVRIIFSSGYSSDTVKNEKFSSEKIVFLEKPYKIDELSKAISLLKIQ